MDGELIHREITELIIRAFFEVYNALGAGFLEAVYKRALVVALREKGLRCEFEKAFTVFYHGQNVGDYRADLVVEGKVIVEAKTAQKIDPGHATQCLNYLKASKLQLGMVLNFGKNAEFERVILSRH
jgi:GxxExxY protein